MVSAGRAHTAAITRDGVAHTWGCRKTGKLGWKRRDDDGGESNNDDDDRRREQIVRRVSLPPSPTFAAAAALADDHTLVLDGNTGGVLAFGENKEGQLGIGSTFQELAAAHLSNWTNAAQETFYRDLAEINSNSERYGSSPPSAAEDAAVAGTTALTPTVDQEGQHAVPAWVVGGGQHRVAAAAAAAAAEEEASEGAHHAATTTTTTEKEEEKEEEEEDAARPVAAFDGKRVVSIAASRYFSAAAVDDGGVYTWGGGFNGELGQWGVSWCTSPRRVTDDDLARLLGEGGGAASVTAGGNFCAAITTEGGLVVWGLSLIHI